MEEYVSAEMQIVAFDAEDVITTSDSVRNPDDPEFTPIG